MAGPLAPSAQKVQDRLRALGFGCQVVALSQTTRSAADAARAVGCEVGQIAKSLVFLGQRTQQPVLVIASGANRVDEDHIAAFLAEPIEKADADFVRRQTGFAIGGVPPVGHPTQLTTLVDEDLLQYTAIWAAAGTPNTVFKLSPSDLVAMTGGRVVSVK